MSLPKPSQDRLKPADFISWKFNRTWQSAHFSDRAMGVALEAAARLVDRGLAEETTCKCKASVIRLTLAGKTLADTLNLPAKR